MLRDLLGDRLDVIQLLDHVVVDELLVDVGVGSVGSPPSPSPPLHDIALVGTPVKPAYSHTHTSRQLKLSYVMVGAQTYGNTLGIIAPVSSPFAQ